MRPFFLVLLLILFPGLALASGFGVFTQGATGLGQANAVVAHPAGPSSIYFNPALLQQVPGRQIEVGTTAISADRSFTSDQTGQKFSADDAWNFPSFFYYTENHGRLASGIGLYFPFGLTTEWPGDYEGRYIGTKGDIFSLNINPAMSYQLTDRLAIAGGLDLVYLNAELRSRINQVAAGLAVPAVLGGPVVDPSMPDVVQSFNGEGWGHGFNLGLTYELAPAVTLGLSYRSEVEIPVHGSTDFQNVDSRLTLFFPSGGGQADITLPQQLAAGLAVKINDALLVEAGFRWEDWESSDQLVITLDRPVLGQGAQVIPRDWNATTAYNLGARYSIHDNLALFGGYLYGEGAVPGATLEPLVPDSDAHLFTLGVEKQSGHWSFAGAVGYEKHEVSYKANAIGDPLTGDPGLTANGKYTSNIYLVSGSIGYRF